jgi:hypothetical protein
LIALISGGYTANNPSGTIYAGNGKDLDSWWFTPAPYPKFDKLKLKAGRLVPSAR